MSTYVNQAVLHHVFRVVHESRFAIHQTVGEEPGKRGLAGPRGTHERDDLPRLDRARRRAEEVLRHRVGGPANFDDLTCAWTIAVWRAASCTKSPCDK